jgi:hypothetical protein
MCFINTTMATSYPTIILLSIKLHATLFHVLKRALKVTLSYNTPTRTTYCNAQQHEWPPMTGPKINITIILMYFIASYVMSVILLRLPTTNR